METELPSLESTLQSGFLAQSKKEISQNQPIRHPRSQKNKKQVTQKDFSQKQQLHTIETQDDSSKILMWPNSQMNYTSQTLNQNSVTSPSNLKHHIVSSKPSVSQKNIICQSAQNFYLQDSISQKTGVDRNHSQVPQTFGGQKFSKTTTQIVTNISQKNKLQKPKIPQYSSNERQIRNKYNKLSQNRDYSLINLKQLNVQFLTKYQGPSSKTVRNSDMIQHNDRHNNTITTKQITDEYGIRNQLLSPKELNVTHFTIDHDNSVVQNYQYENQIQNMSPEMVKQIMNQSAKYIEKTQQFRSQKNLKQSERTNNLQNAHDTENSLQNFKIKNQQMNENNLLQNSPYQMIQKRNQLKNSINDQNQARKNSSHNLYRKKVISRPTTCKNQSSLGQFHQQRATTQTRMGDRVFKNIKEENMVDAPCKQNQQQNRYKDMNNQQMLEDKGINNINVDINNDVIKIQQQLRLGNSSADNKNSRITRDGRPRQFSRGQQMDLSQLYGYPENKKKFTTLENDQERIRQQSLNKGSQGVISNESRTKNKKMQFNNYGAIITSLNTQCQSQETSKRKMIFGSRDSKQYVQIISKAQENGRLFAKEILKIPTQINVNQKKSITSKLSRNQVQLNQNNNTMPIENGVQLYKFDENGQISSNQMNSIKNIISKQVNEKMQIQKQMNQKYGTIEARDISWKGGEPILKQLKPNDQFSVSSLKKNSKRKQEQLSKKLSESLGYKLQNNNYSRQASQDYYENKQQVGGGKNPKQIQAIRTNKSKIELKNTIFKDNQPEKLTNHQPQPGSKFVIKSKAEVQSRKNFKIQMYQKESKIQQKTESEYSPVKKIMSANKDSQSKKFAESDFETFGKQRDSFKEEKAISQDEQIPQPFLKGSSPFLAQINPQNVSDQNNVINAPIITIHNQNKKCDEKMNKQKFKEQQKRKENRRSSKLQQKQHQQQILYHGGSFGMQDAEIVTKEDKNLEQIQQDKVKDSEVSKQVEQDDQDINSTINLEIEISNDQQEQHEKQEKQELQEQEEQQEKLQEKQSETTNEKEQLQPIQKSDMDIIQKNEEQFQEKMNKSFGMVEEKIKLSKESTFIKLKQQKLQSQVKSIKKIPVNDDSSTSSDNSGSSSSSTTSNITSVSKSISKSKSQKSTPNVTPKPKKEEGNMNKDKNKIAESKVNKNKDENNKQPEVNDAPNESQQLLKDNQKIDDKSNQVLQNQSNEEVSAPSNTFDQSRNSRSAMLLMFIDTNLNMMKHELKYSNKQSPMLSPKSSKVQVSNDKIQNPNLKSQVVKSTDEKKEKEIIKGDDSSNQGRSFIIQSESQTQNTPGIQEEEKKNNSGAGCKFEDYYFQKSSLDNSAREGRSALIYKSKMRIQFKHPSPSSTPQIMMRSQTQQEITVEVKESKEPLQTLKAYFEEDEQSSIKPNDSMDQQILDSPQKCTSKLSNMSSAKKQYENQKINFKQQMHVVKSSQEDTDLEQYIESRHSSIAIEQQKGKLKLLSPTQEYPFFQKKPKIARTPSPLQREGLQCIDDAQEYFESTLQLYDKMKRLTLIIKSKSELTVGVVEKLLRSTVLLINDFLKITGLPEEKILQLEKTYENLTKAAINKYRNLIVKSIFKTYLTFKSVEKVVMALVTRRKELQDIGRDNLETKDLVEFIDWRNDNLEAITKKSQHILLLLHEICNLNHLFVWTQKQNKNQDEIFKLASSIQHKNSNSLSKTFSSKNAVQYNPFQNLYDESSSEKVEIDAESQKDVSDGEIEQYYGKDETNTLESQEDECFDEDNSEEDGIQENEQVHNQSENENQIQIKEPVESQDYQDLADILNKQIQIGLQKRDNQNMLETQNRAKAQKQFENTIKKGFFGNQ